MIMHGTRGVLLVEDDHDVRVSIRCLLESEGYEVISAEDGRRGLFVFRTEKPDLVVTDIIMPEKEGIETIRDIRGFSPICRCFASRCLGC